MSNSKWEKFVEALAFARQITPDVADRIKRDPNGREANSVVDRINGSSEASGFTYASVDDIERFLREGK